MPVDKELVLWQNVGWNGLKKATIPSSGVKSKIYLSSEMVVVGDNNFYSSFSKVSSLLYSHTSHSHQSGPLPFCSRLGRLLCTGRTWQSLRQFNAPGGLASPSRFYISLRFLHGVHVWRWVTTSFLKIVTKYFDGKFGTDIMWDEHWFWILKLALNIVIADMFFNDSFSLLQKIRASQVIYSLFFIFLNVFFYLISRLGDKCSEQSFNQFLFFHLYLISSLWKMKLLCKITCVKGVRTTRHLLLWYTKIALRFGRKPAGRRWLIF